MLGPTSLKDKTFILIKSCTLAFSAKESYKSLPIAPSWNSQWALGLNQAGGGFRGGCRDLVVTKPHWTN